MGAGRWRSSDGWVLVLIGATVSPSVSMTTTNVFEAVCWLLDVEAWLMLVLFLFLDWLLLPRCPSFKCCFFLSFRIFFRLNPQPQPYKSLGDFFLYLTACRKPAGE